MNPIDLSYEILGDGERKLIILHGLFGMGRNWKRVAKMLGKTHQVLTVDLRNHGSSPWTNAMTYETMAADVAMKWTEWDTLRENWLESREIKKYKLQRTARPCEILHNCI